MSFDKTWYQFSLYFNDSYLQQTMILKDREEGGEVTG